MIIIITSNVDHASVNNSNFRVTLIIFSICVVFVMVFVVGVRFIWCTCSTVFSVKALHTKQHAVAFKTCCFAATATAAACGIHCIYVVCLIMLAMSMNFLSFALTRADVCVLVCVNGWSLRVDGVDGVRWGSVECVDRGGDTRVARVINNVK